MNIYKALTIPQTIYTTESKYNGKIEVIQVGNTRKIKVDGIYQSLNWDSPSCKKLVWGKAVDLLKRLEPELKSVLILGLGGGAMQHLLSKAYPNISIVSVEIDNVMVDIAKKYFDLDKIPNHKVIVGDAFKVVVEPEEYDLSPDSFGAIIVDIYVGEKYPDLGNSGNFIAALKRLVIPGGLIIFNRIYLRHHQDDVDTFINQIEGVLEEVATEIVPGYTNSDNILVFGRNFKHTL